MSLLSTAAQTASLNNDYGASKGANAAASHEVALFDGDPALGGTELTSTGGYGRVTIANNGTTWPGASGGSTTSTVVTFPTSSAAWSDTATHFVLFDAATGDQWDDGLLSEEIAVDVADVTPSVQLTIFYDNTGA